MTAAESGTAQVTTVFEYYRSEAEQESAALKAQLETARDSTAGYDRQ